MCKKICCQPEALRKARVGAFQAVGWLEHSEWQALQFDVLSSLDPFGFKLVFITAKALFPSPFPIPFK